MSKAIDKSTSIRQHIAFLDGMLADPRITEIAINKPGQVYYENNSGWQPPYDEPEATYERIHHIAEAVARFSDNNISSTEPLLSARLPDGERIQIVFPPACTDGTISITIRKPSNARFTMQDYIDQGFFDRIEPVTDGLTKKEKALRYLLDNGRPSDFVKEAIKEELVIVVSGKTGSGKTTFMKMLVDEIPVKDRIITIEDVPELFLPNHDNHVHLFYPSESEKSADSIVTPASLLKSCLRMKPDRILIAELRGAEAFDFINIVSSGHGGSITSAHAGSPSLLFERLALMVLQNEKGVALPYDVIRRLLFLAVDVVIQIDSNAQGSIDRYITDIWYEPAKKRMLSE